MSGIVLSASVRQNLLSLQSTADLMITTTAQDSSFNGVNLLNDRGSGRTAQAFGGAWARRARRSRRPQDRTAYRQSRSLHRQQIARCRRQSEDLPGDPDLDVALSEIELRVEVELAKAGQF
jgi:hypothetical protein